MMIIDGARYLSVREFCWENEGISQKDLRNMLSARHKNGLATAVYRFGPRKLMIREDAFWAWFRSRQEG